MKRLVIHLGLLPGESCGDWDSNLASVTDSDGARIGYVEQNDGATVTVMVLEDQLEARA